MIQWFVASLFRFFSSRGMCLASGYLLMFGSGECLEFGWGEGVSAVDAPQYARRGEGVGVGVGSDPGDAFELPPGPI